MLTTAPAIVPLSLEGKKNLQGPNAAYDVHFSQLC